MTRNSATPLKSVILIMLLVVAAACKADNNVGPPGAATGQDTLVTLFGNAQDWFAGSELPEPVVAAVYNSKGTPLSGVTVRFSNASGFDSTRTTDNTGLAVVRWKLPSQPGINRLDVKVGNKTPIVDALFARGIPRDSADVIIVHGVTATQFQLIDVDRDKRRVYRLTRADTVISLIPHSGSGSAEELIALTSGHPPESVPSPWTPKPDTVHIRFQPPIRVALTLWYINDSTRAAQRAATDLGAINALFTNSIMGLAIGTVTVRNVSNVEFPTPSCVVQPSAEVRNEINVYYLKVPFPSSATNAMTCQRQRVLIAPIQPGTAINQFAHEMGHSFNWTHTIDTRNLMSENVTGTQITLGQVLQAHFWTTSSLNELYKLNRRGVRSCAEANLRCMEPEWDGQ